MPIYLKAGSFESLNRRYMSSNSPVGTLEVTNNNGTNLDSLKLSFKPEAVTPPDPITKEIHEILEIFSNNNDAVLPYLLTDDSPDSRSQWGWKIYKKDSRKLADLLDQLSPEEFKKLTEGPLFRQFIKDAEEYGLIPEGLDLKALRKELILALWAASQGEIPDTIKELQAIYCKLPDNKPIKSISERSPPPPHPLSTLPPDPFGLSKNTLTPTSPDPLFFSATKKVNEDEIYYLKVQQDDLCVTNPEKKSNTKDCEPENFYFTSQKEQDLRKKLDNLPTEDVARLTPPPIASAFDLAPNMSSLSLEIAIAESKYHTVA